MDNGEQELSGLIGSIQEGRLIQNATNGNKLMFAELQPHRSYQITLSSDLRNDPEYLVSTTRLTVDTPGSGYRVINVPVAKSFEITGLWTTDDGIQVQPGRTRLIFTKIDGNSDIRGTLFGDGSWIVDKISPGTYTIFVSDNSNSNLAVYPNTIQVMANQDVSSKVIVIRNKA
jgi:hypothetical protein